MRPSTALSQQENFEVPPVPGAGRWYPKTTHYHSSHGEDLQEDYMDYSE